MIEVKIKGIQETIASLNALEKEQLPFAISKAMNDTAVDVNKGMELELQMKLHMPTRFVVTSPKYIKSTKRDLRLVFGYESPDFPRNRAGDIVTELVVGGTRSNKRFEKALIRLGIMPTSHQIVTTSGYRDQAGNMRGSDAMRILSALGAAPDPLANRTDRSKKQNKTLQEFFAIRVGRGSHLHPGIYHRSGTHGCIVSPVCLFILPPSYKAQQLNPIETVAGVWRDIFPRRFEAALEYALKTARK